MCSFGSCQTRFEFLSQFRKVRNAFECFVTQVQTNAFAKNQMRLAYEDKRDLYCMCRLLRWSCRRKKQLPPRVRGWSGANFLMYPSDNQRECEGSGKQHSYSMSLTRSQGLTLARCCIQTRGLSRGIKIVMDSHTILTMLMLVLNLMFLYMYVYSTNHVYLHRFSRLRFCVWV